MLEHRLKVFMKGNERVIHDGFVVTPNSRTNECLEKEYIFRLILQVHP